MAAEPVAAKSEGPTEAQSRELEETVAGLRRRTGRELAWIEDALQWLSFDLNRLHAMWRRGESRSLDPLVTEPLTQPPSVVDLRVAAERLRDQAEEVIERIARASDGVDQPVGQPAASGGDSS